MEEDQLCAQKEFGSIRLGDRRLDRRLVEIMERLINSPQASIYGAMEDVSEAKGAYRLFGHESVTADKILQPHRKQIQKRAADQTEVLIVQDTTTLNYTSHVMTEDLGSIAQGFKGKNSQGLFVHTAYVLDSRGVPLGVLDQLSWSREQLKEGDKLYKTENWKWHHCLRFADKFSKSGKTRVVHVCDREGDYWDLIDEIHKRKESFVIRLIKQRCLAPTLEELFGQTAIAGEYSAEMTLYGGAQKGVSRYARKREKVDVCFEVSFAKLDLSRTAYPKRADASAGLEIYLVRAREKNPPADREPLEWILKTDRQVGKLEDALRVIEIYRCRWQIESFHKILKSGCGVEKARLGTADGLIRYTTAMSVVAWRLHNMSQRNRTDPDINCTVVLSESEWKSLYCRINKTRQLPKKAPTLNQAIRWIAQLGGFKGRKSDGDPGFITLWRGWNKLAEMAELYELLVPVQQTCG